MSEHTSGTPADGDAHGGGPQYRMRTANAVLKDSLHLDGYRKVFATIIKTADPPATVGLYGEWGTGKTSFLRQVQADLAQAADGWSGAGYPTVWFDLWEHERNPAPVVAMLNVARHKALAELDRRLEVTTEDAGPLRTRWEGLKKTLEAHKDTLANAARALGRAVVRAPGLTFNVGAVGVEGANPVADAMAYYQEIQTEQFRVVDEQTRLRDELAAVVADLAEVARSGNDSPGAETKPVVFFIDDLDRCPPGVMVNLLEQVRLFLSAPQCVFVVGMDDGVVVQAVVRERPELVGVTRPADGDPVEAAKSEERAARRYLEKMIQYPFMLPRLSQTKIEEFTKAVLRDVGFKDAEAAIVDQIVPLILHERRDQLSLRFVVRLANALVLNHMLAQENITNPDLRVTALVTVLQHAYNAEWREALAQPGGGADLWRRLTSPPPIVEGEDGGPLEFDWWATWPPVETLLAKARAVQADGVAASDFEAYVDLASATEQVVEPLAPDAARPGDWSIDPGEGVAAEAVEAVVEQLRSHQVQPGQTVTVGRCSWILLDQDDHRALLLAADVLGHQPYHHQQQATTWAECSLRAVLNETEFPQRLGRAWWNRLVERDCPNEDNPNSGALGGESTRDRIFLLSIDEYKKYRQIINKVGAWWWLRSPGGVSAYAALVFYGGVVDGRGDGVSASSGGVRPVLSLSL